MTRNIYVQEADLNNQRDLDDIRQTLSPSRPENGLGPAASPRQ
jgi:hypothetical protein